MSERYIIEERVFSPKGQGAYPGHRQAEYIVRDTSRRMRNGQHPPMHAVSTREAAEGAIERREAAERKRRYEK